MRGIAVTSASATNGTWQFSLNAGASWSNVGNSSDVSARLIPAYGLVRFVPIVVFSMVAGVAADAFDRRHLLIAVQAFVAAVTVPLAFATMVVVSRMTASQIPADSLRIFARMHLPEGLGMGLERVPRG